MVDQQALQNSPSCRFPESPEVMLEPEQSHCSCGQKLKVRKTQRRMITTMAIGKFHIHETIKECPDCKRFYKPEQAQEWAPSHCNYGYDVIEHIGKELFLENRNEKQVWDTLRTRNVWISKSEIACLARKFIVYLALAQQEKQTEIRQLLDKNGGYMLHMDGTSEGGGPHLIAAMDSITQMVLGSTKVVSEAVESLTPFLKDIKERYGNPIAVVSDMSRAFAKAIVTVFPDTPHFICHFHFLRDTGKDLFAYEYTTLREDLRRFKIRPALHKMKKELKPIYESSCQVQILESCPSIELLEQQFSPEIIAYLLIHWILDFEQELDGYGFPFDRGYLILYRRMSEVHNGLKEYRNPDGYLAQLKRHLDYFLEDKNVQRNVNVIEKKVKHFDQLRVAMRIAQPNDKNGLNDEGDDDIDTIEKAVTTFVNSPSIQYLASIDDDYKGMLKQIHKYWKKLFTDPIIVTREGKKYKIQPQRTNNILEHLFRNSQNGHRHKTGKNSRAKALQTMLADTLLVQNLENADVCKILLNGKATLAERFAQMDEKNVRERIQDIEDQKNKLSSAIKKILRKTKNFPARLLGLVA